MDRNAELGAVIDAEGLVVHGKARVDWRRSGFAVHYRMDFCDDRGEPCRLELVQRFDEWTLRACTELAGTLSGKDATWGNACLRLDYRELSLGTLWDVTRTLREIY
jgi:hypothetical protein